jgi:hypothetical protein
MDPVLFVYFIGTYALTMTLGFFQTGSGVMIPVNQSEQQAERGGCREIAWPLALLLICGQGLVSILALGSTEYFPLAALFLAFTLLCHHTIIHRHSKFEGETCSCAPFQCKDISNHESWVLASLVAAGISYFHI